MLCDAGDVEKEQAKGKKVRERSMEGLTHGSSG